MTEFERVRAELGPVLMRLAASYAPPGPDRDDLSQEIAMALVQALPSYRGDSSLRTYVLRIAHNCGVRRIARRGTPNAPFEDSGHPSPAPGPEREAAARQEVERLAAALRELPLGSRQVLVLALEGLSHVEIGEVLGLAENVVSVRLHRARSALRQRLAEAPHEEGAAHG